MNRKVGKPISPEKLGKIAERGTENVHLSKEEWLWLKNEGYEAIESFNNVKNTAIKLLPEQLVCKALDAFFPVASEPSLQPLHLRCINGILKLVTLPATWNSGSPAFTWRSDKDDRKRLTFHHTEQKVTAHIELLAHEDDSTDISVRCCDPSGAPVSSMEVELLRDGRCEESVASSDSGPLTISNVKKGPMQLCIHAARSTRITIDLRVD